MRILRGVIGRKRFSGVFVFGGRIIVCLVEIKKVAFGRHLFEVEKTVNPLLFCYSCCRYFS